MNASDFLKDEVVLTQPLYKTKDYSKFKILLGNRPIDKRHVGIIKSKIEKQGNLTQYFPIQVNEKFEIIDGQHRMRACEELNQPFYYEIKEGLNVDSVISLNTGHRNWGWKDFAESYRERGNSHYELFLQLSDTYPKLPFSTLYLYATLGAAGKTGLHANIGMGANKFRSGELKIQDFELSKKLLKQLDELSMITNVGSRDFATASFRFMRTPTYNHDLMLKKLNQYGAAFMNVYTISDFLYTFDSIWKKSI